MGPEGNKLVVRQFIEEVLNKRNVEAAGEYFTEDMVELVPFPGQGPGLAGLKDVVRGLHAAFPDMHWTIEEQIAEGDRVMTRFTWSGTNGGSFMGMMRQLGHSPAPAAS
jgi:predicted ester cyclase